MTESPGSLHLLVQLLIARLTHPHFLLNAELGDGGVLGRALAAEDLPTCPAVVLGDGAGQL